MFPSKPRSCPPGIVLLLAVKSGDVGRTSALLRSGVNPDAVKDARGNTALHVAALHGHAEVARALVGAGASTEALSPSEGLTPLRLAAESGHLLAARVLLDANADAATEDFVDRATPLHAAAEAGHVSVVLELAGRGVNLEARAVSGQTPLRWALSLGREDAAVALLQSGANPDAPDRSGGCCLHAVAALRWEEGEDRSYAPSSWSPAAMAYLLLSYGASPNLVRRPPFVSPPGPVSNGNYDSDVAGSGSAATGIGRGGLDHAGETPLHVAARECSVQVAQVLLKNGADPNARTSLSGLTPLHCAAAPGDNRRKEIVRVLLEAGADINAVAADGKTTPLRLACLDSAVGCVEELLRLGADERPSFPVSAALVVSYSYRTLYAIATGSLATPIDAGNHLYGGQGNHSPPPPSSPYSEAANGEARIPNGIQSRSLAAAAPLEALVGLRVPVSAKDSTDEERIRHLLQKAPLERSWRRRGWLIMMYARTSYMTTDEIFFFQKSPSTSASRTDGWRNDRYGVPSGVMVTECALYSSARIRGMEQHSCPDVAVHGKKSRRAPFRSMHLSTSLLFSAPGKRKKWQASTNYRTGGADAPPAGKVVQPRYRPDTSIRLRDVVGRLFDIQGDQVVRSVIEFL